MLLWSQTQITELLPAVDICSVLAFQPNCKVYGVTVCHFLDFQESGFQLDGQLIGIWCHLVDDVSPY